ncbi:MAG: ATP-dependent sacrificial sulfur transferase LarE, partial [bacterium]
DAVRVAAEIGIDHRIIPLQNMDETILGNPVDRCYHCKTVVFSKLQEIARALGRTVLLDGSNLDDLDDYRPGLKAKEELGVRSPFLEARLTKADIRQLSRSRGLSTWNKPSMACLASRIPHHDPITSESLRMVETAESFLKNLGLKQFRVRKHGDLARIEVSAGERPLFFNPTLMETVSRELKKTGFRFVALDLEGFQSGSLN